MISSKKPYPECGNGPLAEGIQPVDARVVLEEDKVTKVCCSCISNQKS